MNRTRSAILALVVAAILLGSAGCSIFSDEQSLFAGYDASSESRTLDFSSVRPTFWPRQNDELAGIDRAVSPRLNGEESTGLAIGGDARKFVLLRDADTNSDFRRSIDVEWGKTYEGYVFFMNGSPTDSENRTNSDLTSRDTRLSLSIPKSVRASVSLSATLLSSNAQPGSVGSSSVLQSANATDTIYMQLQSAEMFTQDNTSLGYLDTDDLKSPRGALIGCDNSQSGSISPGCSGYVRFRVEATKSSFETQFTVGLDNGSQWQNYLSLAANTGVWVRLAYSNSGRVDQENLTIKFSLRSSTFGFTEGKSLQTDAKGVEGAISNAELDAGKNVGNVPTNKTVTVIARMSLSSDGLEELCRNGVANVDADVKLDDFYSFRRTASVFPDESIC